MRIPSSNTDARATMAPKLSVIVVFHNMRREAPRTLLSLAATYQRGVPADAYEVIAIDNNSTEPLNAAEVEAIAPNFRYAFHTTTSESPVEAVNKGVGMARGDHVAIFDGRGHEALARVEAAGPSRVIVRPTSSRQAAPEPSVALTLAQAMLKSDKMEAVIRDAVMLGVAAVQPFLSSRTEVPRSALSRVRSSLVWSSVNMVSSLETSLRASIDEVAASRSSQRTCAVAR